MDLDRLHLGSIFGKFLARRGDNRQHDVVEDVHARLIRLFKRLADDIIRQAHDLQIHLDGCDAFFSTADLEVHVAEKVLKPLDIDHGHPAVALGNQAAGNAGDRALDRHARVHQRQRRAADRTL